MAAKPSKKIRTPLLPKQRREKQRLARKAKPSVQKRYQSRDAKRKAWADAHPDLVPGAIGRQAAPKPPLPAPTEQA